MGILFCLLLIQAPVNPVPGPSRPPWVERLPEAPGRVYAMGTADLNGPEGRSIARASDRARVEVVARFRASVKGQTTVVQRGQELRRDGQGIAGSGERLTREELTVGARAEDLPGLVVEQTFTDPGARTVYALAYLDLAQAAATLSGRLDQIKQARLRVGQETSRRALWNLRKLTQDLERLEASVALLGLAGTGSTLGPALLGERAALEARRDQLNQAALPPVDFSRTAMAVHANVDLPPGVETFLKAQVASCGLLSREAGPDMVLSLAFSGGSRGPEFIFADMDIYRGVTYRMEATLTLTEGGGAPLTRPVPILLVQGDSPEGMVNQFRRQIERWLPRLLGELKAEMQ